MVSDLRDKTELGSYGFSHRSSGFAVILGGFTNERGRSDSYFRRNINQVSFLDAN
jgi:hypothetical protein